MSLKQKVLTSGALVLIYLAGFFGGFIINEALNERKMQKAALEAYVPVREGFQILPVGKGYTFILDRTNEFCIFEAPGGEMVQIWTSDCQAILRSTANQAWGLE